jgi:hypothetical protein
VHVPKSGSQKPRRLVDNVVIGRLAQQPGAAALARKLIPQGMVE